MAIARVTLEFNSSAVQRIGMDEATRRVTQVTRAIYNRANILTPVKTGHLRRNNDWRIYTAGLTVRGEVYNNTDYAAAVHNGAKARVIYAKTRPWKGGGALRFKYNGRTIYRHKVNWPGTKPRPWLATAMIEVAPRYGFLIADAGPAAGLL